MTDKGIQREFFTGESWLYYKIYTGTKTLDVILRDSVRPLSSHLVENNIVDKWFFIRYADPKPHIRLRFHCNDKNKLGLLMDKVVEIFKPLCEQGLVWKIQTDTYKRELERYGSNTMELSETFFFHDSTLITNLMDVFQDDEEMRWQVALLYIDNLFGLFKYPFENRIRLMEHLKTAFGEEFNMDKNLSRQIDTKFRNSRSKIEGILTEKRYENFDFQEILLNFQNYTTNVSELADEILRIRNSNELEIGLDSLLSSYIHMAMVRLFKTKNRAHELIIYEFVFRQYRSMKARMSMPLS